MFRVHSAHIFDSSPFREHTVHRVQLGHVLGGGGSPVRRDNIRTEQPQDHKIPVETENNTDVPKKGFISTMDNYAINKMIHARIHTR